MPPVENKAQTSDPRRRFLRETLKGSIPLVLSWIAGRARGLAHALEAAPAPRQTSPPPQAPSDLPQKAKQEIDRRYDEFARDNPEHDPFQP